MKKCSVVEEDAEAEAEAEWTEEQIEVGDACYTAVHVLSVQPCC